MSIPHKQDAARAIFIPARLESTRLPRKMLLPVPTATGTKPLICVTAENASQCKINADIYVCTDSDEIIETLYKPYGVGSKPFRIVKTSPAISGTARVFEALRILRMQGIFYENIAIVQGDVPDIRPQCIELLFSNYRRVTTLVTDFKDDERLFDNCVKAICGRQVCYQDIKPNIGELDDVYYFTRCPIPYANKHIGVYGLNGTSLLQDISEGNLTFKDNCFVEEQEDLEQLNWIVRGYTVTAKYVTREMAGSAIDTRADYDAFCAKAIK